VSSAEVSSASVPDSPNPGQENTADRLFLTVRALLTEYLTEPRKDSEIAAALDVSLAQAKIWIQRLVDEGVVEKRTRPVCYAMRERHLFN
jgi:predicted ArsR family transcriptional regulator